VHIPIRIRFSPTERDALIKTMKKKAKSSRSRITSTETGERFPREKAAVRSRAFAKAMLEAKSHAADPKRLRALFQEASEKAASIPKAPFKDTWAYLQAMLRLIRAYSRGEYLAVSQSSLLSIIAALNYLVNPFDLIPDEIPFLGFLDDATVMAFAVQRTREDLDDFMTWETTTY
jgi:uncharacterized membrane protein YkvA (DUF1232 family)